MNANWSANVTKIVVFDSWALIALLDQEEPAASRVRLLLHETTNGKSECMLSLINLGEIYYIMGRKHGKRAADETLELLQRLPILLTAVAEETVMAAASYKMLYPISYADAFALDTAIRHRATLYTGDPEFTRVSHLVNVEFLNATS